MLRSAANAAYRALVVVLLFASLALSVYFYADKLFFRVHDNLFIAFAWFAVFSVLLFAFLGRLNFIYFLGLGALMTGAYMSWKELNSLEAFVFYGLFGLIFGLGFFFDRYRDKALTHGPAGLYDENYKPSLGLPALWLATAAVFIIAGILSWDFLYHYFNCQKIFRFYFAARHNNVPVNNMCGNPFEQYGALWLHLVFIAVVIGVSLRVFGGKIKKRIFLFFILVFTAFAAKILIASLSTFGMDIIKMKTVSKYNGTYYYFAQKAGSIIEFMKNYVPLHQVFHDNAHLKGHPVGAVVFYWVICHFISCDPVFNALVLGFITSLTSIALFIITRIILKNDRAAFAAGLFYALCPNSVILSIAGIDSLIAAAVAWAFAFYMLGLEKRKWAFFFLSGLVFGIGANLTFGIWHILLPLFLLFFTVANIHKLVHISKLKQLAVVSHRLSERG